MPASLSSLVDNLSEINNNESINELIKKFPNTYQFCNKDLNRFILLLRKAVYPYEYMDSRITKHLDNMVNKKSW